MAGIDQSNKSDGSSPSPAVDTSARGISFLLLLRITLCRLCSFNPSQRA